MGQRWRIVMTIAGLALLSGCGPTTSTVTATTAPTALSVAAATTVKPVTTRPMTPTPSTRPPETPRTAPTTAVTPTASAIPWVDRPVAVQPPWTGPVRVHRTPLYHPCSAADLTAAAANSGAAAGTTFDTVTLTNRSAGPCTLSGVPEAVIGVERTGRTSRLRVYAQPYNLDSIDLIANLRPGQRGVLDLSHASSCSEDHRYPPFTHLEVRLAGGGVVLARTDRDPTLVRGCSITTSDFGTQYVDRPDPRDPVASMSVPAQLAAGNPMSYVVTLTNPGSSPITLRPCPSYTERVVVLVARSTTALISSGTYALNCDGVSAIAPHRALRFAMRITVPEAIGPAKVQWQLQGRPVLTGAASESLRP